MYEEMWTSINIDVDIVIDTIKTIVLSIFVYCSIFKMINEKQKNNKIFENVLLILVSLFCEFVKYKIGFSISILCQILLISLIYDFDNIGKSILTTSISFVINYAFLVIAIFIDIIFYAFITQNDYINLVVIIAIYTIILTSFFRIEKFKYGFNFLKNKQKDDDIEILAFTCTNVLLLITLLYYSDNYIVKEITICFMICIMLMILNIKKLVQNNYKKNLLVKELEETKSELEDKNKQIKEMEEEILNFNKKSHSIAHKQKVLEYKIEKLSLKCEASEEIGLQDGVKDIKKEISNNIVNEELEKTNVNLIDDMLEFMKSECDKNKIEFNLKVYGNITSMIKNTISKEELEILIADHVKNSIIAIKHSENINKSILVKLGKIDDYYGLYIYDSGIEFSDKILENLGKNAITTYKEEGGSGMGFLNTFDTLNKYRASFIIEKIGKPTKDNYTKVIKIKFDNRNEVKIQ